LAIAYTIIISPMWNAYTDAYVKHDYAWIRRTFRYALVMWAGTIVAGLLMLVLSPYFFDLWIGQTVSVPMSVSASVLGFICFFNLNNCLTMLINGLNKIYVQIIISIVVTAAYIAVILINGKQLGIEGIVNCMTVSYIFMSIIHLYQCRLLIGQRATGIWNK
jgi:O-antigen/teichoic acid export membrane protein